jgi:type IX secretion system PorP/SprF family membrane protein
MFVKTERHNIERILLTIVFVSSLGISKGQQSPLSPLSYWVFTPYTYNPAMVGSKDFLSIGATAAFQDKSNAQLISFNTRLTKNNPRYFLSPETKEFRNIGIGASVFKDFDGFSRNTGLSASASYHIQLDSRALSFLSIGVALKDEYSSINSLNGNFVKKNFYPNLDIGIYYYGTNFFAGISAINLLGSPWKPDTLGNFIVPVSKEYFFTAGTKIILSRSLNIVLEPSVLILTTDSTLNKLGNNIFPILKLYLGDFCVGASYRNVSKLAVFAQFRYPKFYVGAYYELSSTTPYYKNKPTVEFTLGLNIQNDRSRITNYSQW